MKARVLPEPVWATLMTSALCMASGTLCACTGVGTSKPAKRRLRSSSRPQLSPENCVTALAASASSALRLGGRSILTGISAYLAKSMPEVIASPNCARKLCSSSARLSSKSSPPSRPCHFQVLVRPAESGCHGGAPRAPRFCAARCRASGSGLGVWHLKQRLLEAKTFSWHVGQVQSPGLMAPGPPRGGPRGPRSNDCCICRGGRSRW